MPFSTVVATAQSKGYTEPDPRDDLSGMDVARKIVILAREVHAIACQTCIAAVYRRLLSRTTDTCLATILDEPVLFE
eukprot:scaffold472668_cov22-Prasinocladus_malaysianus.AAC.1